MRSPNRRAVSPRSFNMIYKMTLKNKNKKLVCDSQFVSELSMAGYLPGKAGPKFRTVSKNNNNKTAGHVLAARYVGCHCAH